MLKIKSSIAITLIFVIFISSVSATVIKQSNYEQKIEEKVITTTKWTVMYYMCCDSNMQPHAEPLLENLSKIGSNNEFNLVAMYDGDAYGDSKIIYFNETGARINLNNKIGWPSEVDYADHVTFEQFIKDMMNYYPAENYAVIFYGSAGAGWQVFHLHDAYGTTYKKFINEGNAGVSTPKLGSLFKNITNNGEEKIDVIYTSCAMNTIELAYEISPYVSYMIGTQDCLSREFIYRYYKSVWELYNNTDMTPDEFSEHSSDILRPKSFYYQDEWEFGIGLINKFFNNRDNKKLQTVKHHDNIGIINNSNINNLIKSVDNLSKYLILNIQDKKILNDISAAREFSRESSKCYAKPNSKIMNFLHGLYRFNFTAYNGVIDLYDFCEKLREKTENEFLKTYCNDVMENINKTVPYINKIENDPIHGLNIYFPIEKEVYNAYVLSGEIPAKYEELALSKNTCWDEFLKKYLKI